MKNFSFFNKLILFFVCSLAFIGLSGTFDVFASEQIFDISTYAQESNINYYREDIMNGFLSSSPDDIYFFYYQDSTAFKYRVFLFDESSSFDFGSFSLVEGYNLVNRYTSVDFDRSKRENNYDLSSYSYNVDDLNFSYSIIYYNSYLTLSSYAYTNPSVYVSSIFSYDFFDNYGILVDSDSYLTDSKLLQYVVYDKYGVGSFPDGFELTDSPTPDGETDSSLDLVDFSAMIQSPYKINDFNSQFSNILSDLFGRLNLGFTQNPNYYITPNIQMSWSSPDFYDSDNGFIARDYVHFKIWYSGTFSYYQELFSSITDLPSYSRSYEKLLVYDGSADQQFNHFFNTYRADISSSLDSSFYDMCYGQIEINDLGDALVQMTSIGRNPLDVLSYRIKNDVNYIYIQAYYIDSDDVMHQGAVSYLELTDNGLIVHSGVTDTDDDSSSNIESGDFDQVVSGNGIDIDNDIKMVSGNEPDQVTDEPNIINNNNNYYTYNYYYDYTDSEQNSNFLDIFWKMVSVMTNMVGKLSSYLRYCFTGSFT